MDVDTETPATPEVLVEEFFRAGRAPVDTHEEWLLRLCAQLMDREARCVSLLEQQTQQQPRRRGRRGGGQKCSPSSASAPFTAASTETGSTSWSES